MNLRYVIVHHTGIPHPHYDLMFELASGSKLATWRSPAWPIVGLTELEQLDDHRPDYLDYEGPLSDNRGQVSRVEAGAFQFDLKTDDRIVLRTDQGLQFFMRRQPNSPLWMAEVGQTA